MFHRLLAAARQLRRLARLAGALDEASSKLRPYTVVLFHPADPTWPALIRRELAPSPYIAHQQAYDDVNRHVCPNMPWDDPYWAQVRVVFKGWPEHDRGTTVPKREWLERGRSQE
ncbi:hypothetical protein OG871_40660 (plasmid) [Kitasatospora sp. NBC_00374]|uniref:hypothetical protein n=1 Tax=Kitasatospora sp. NBC_00374 TaxID=2975964 RepID=UPI002F918718